jgi:hypothetical protein
MRKFTDPVSDDTETFKRNKRQLSPANLEPNGSKKARQEPSDITPSTSDRDSENLARKSRLAEGLRFIVPRNRLKSKYLLTAQYTPPSSRHVQPIILTEQAQKLL